METKIRFVSWKEQFSSRNNAVSQINAFVNVRKGHFTSHQFTEYVANILINEKERMKQNFKHYRFRECYYDYISGYVDSIRNRISREDTTYAYRIFGKIYSIHNQKINGVERYDTLCREVWTDPDFSILGFCLWKDTLQEYYGFNIPESQFPYFVFYWQNGSLKFTATISAGNVVSGSEPCTAANDRHRVALRVAKTYGIKIYQMEEL